MKNMTFSVGSIGVHQLDASTAIKRTRIASDLQSSNSRGLSALGFIFLLLTVLFPGKIRAADCPVNQHIIPWANEVGREWASTTKFPYCADQAGTLVQGQYFYYYGPDAIAQAKGAISACSPTFYYSPAKFTYTLTGFDPPVVTQGGFGYSSITWRASVDGPSPPYSPSVGAITYQCDCSKGYYKAYNQPEVCLPGYFVAPPPMPVPAIADEGEYCPACKIPGDPVNPSNGSELLTEDDAYADTAGLLKFSRYYNSIDTRTVNMSPGWRGSFSRSLTFEHTFPQFGPQTQNVSNGNPTPRDACYTGWNSIRKYVPGRELQTASWDTSTNICRLSDGSVLPIFQQQPYPPAQATPVIAYIHATRDDGHISNFAVSGSNLVAEQGVAVRLKAISNGYQLIDELDNIETYDSTGKLLSVADRAGNLQTLNYAGPSGALSSVSDNLGRSLSLGYDASNRLRTVTGPDGPVQYEYDAAGHLWKITNTDGSNHQFLYQDSQWPNGISSRIDENNQTNLLWQFDTRGRVTSAKLGGVASGMSFVYNANGSTTETDPLGATHTFAAKQIGNHMRSTGVNGDPCVPCGFSKAISYDGSGYPASVTDYNDNVTLYAYDAVRGLELSRTEAHATPQARTVATAWHSTYRLPIRIDEYVGEAAAGTPKRSTIYTYDPVGNLLTLSIKDGASGRSRTTTFSNYTANGKPQTIDGPRSDITDITQLAYYPVIPGDPKSGQLRTIANALGHVTTFNAYDIGSRPSKITDANGLVTLLGYDTRGRLHTSQMGSQITTLDYWPTSQLKRIALPSGVTFDYVYNAAHQLIEISNQKGEYIRITPDALGNTTKTEVYDAGGALVQTHSRQFNALNQLASDIGAYNNETTTYTYDGNGNLRLETDPLLGKTINEYDALDRLSKITDPKLNKALFGVNAFDRLTAVTDPRQLVTTYAPDALDNLSQSSSSDSGVSTQPQIDSAGNVLQHRDAKGQLSAYTYDALNRLTQITRSDSTVIVFRYDQNDTSHGFGVGRLTGMTHYSGSTEWTYDRYGNITKKAQNIDGSLLKTTYSYDGVTNRLLSMTLPSTKVVAYTWTMGEVTALTFGGSALVSNILYQPFGGPRSWQLANGEIDTRTYDLNGRITGDPVETISYDTAGRITSVKLGNHSAVTGSQSYGYDENDRLTSYTGSGGPIIYNYDANGNRISKTVKGILSVYTLDPGSNRITKVTTGSSNQIYGYDANGSRISVGGSIFGFDVGGRLTSYTSGTKAATYAYDGTGARVRKTVNADTTLFAYDLAGHLIGEYSAGKVIQETFYLGDMPISVYRSSKLYALHADYRNTPRQLDDANQVAVWAWTPLPFGESAPVANSVTYNLRFPGQYFDSESGLFQNGLRDYDPAGGVYIESDPIGLIGGLNTYAYAAGNPLNYTDPIGLQAIPFPATIVPIAGVPNRSLMAQQDLAGRLSRALDDFLRDRTYQTYTRYNPVTGQCYSGRTSGYEDPQTNILNRARAQLELNSEGFLPPILDRSSINKFSIRGREQQLIELNGGAQSVNGISRNLINGISSLNLAGPFYRRAAISEFGQPIPNGNCTCTPVGRN